MPDQEMSATAKSAAAKLFDLRLLIGGLFVLYGVLLIIYSFFTSEQEIAKSAGLHINLWLGIGMLVLGIVFLLWRKLSPGHQAEPNPTHRDERPDAE